MQTSGEIVPSASGVHHLHSLLSPLRNKNAPFENVPSRGQVQFGLVPRWRILQGNEKSLKSHQVLLFMISFFTQLDAEFNNDIYCYFYFRYQL